jgi:cytochrome c oxidase cbb3-type subunit 3
MRGCGMRWCAIGLLVLIAAGCGRPSLQRQALPPHAILDFATLFHRNCAGCHGENGAYGPAPPLNDPLFLQIISDDEMKRIMSEGRALMPAWAVKQRELPKYHVETRFDRRLTPEQIDVLIRGIRESWQKPVVTEDSVGRPPPYALAEASRGNPQAGEKVFTYACASCHGAKGEGGDAGPLHDPYFLALISDQELRRIVITGRPDLGMPDYRTRGDRSKSFKPLTSQEIANVVAYVASWREPYLPPAKKPHQQTSGPGK